LRPQRTIVALALLALLAPACTLLIPGTMPHDRERDARALERDRCDGAPVDPRIYGVDIIQKVGPYYRYVMGGPSGKEAHLAGAELELRPLPGVTAELLERGLACHAAQTILGRVEAAANDPYVLPGAWVKLDVKSGGGTFVVMLSAEDPERAREVLERAKAFVARR
jgi:hypothetical protein